MVLLYLFGTKRADIIQSVPLLLVFFAGVIRFAMKIESLSEEAELDGLIGMVNKGKEFMEKQGVKIFAVALLCMSLAYFLSVKIVQKKRGLD